MTRPPYYFATRDSIVIFSPAVVTVIGPDGVWKFPEMEEPYRVDTGLKWPHFGKIAARLEAATSILTTTMGEKGLEKTQAHAKAIVFASMKEMEPILGATKAAEIVEK